MKNKLMILGSLQEFVPLVKLAKERGYATVVVDGYKDGPAKKLADVSYNADVMESHTIAGYCELENVNGIITSYSDKLFEALVNAAARTDLKCYATPDMLPYYRDKAVMKKLLNDLGIPTPRHVCLSKGYSDDELKDIRFPVVTKPIDMYGSRGLYVLNNPQEVRQFFNRACSTSRKKSILVEEYNTGYEFNLMSWVYEGTVHILGIADREKTSTGSKDIPISTRNIYPSRLIDQVYEPAKAILEKYIKATGQKNGALSMQFFWSPGQEVEVCEIAGRLLGYEHELIEYSSGLSTEQVLLDYLYDEKTLKHNLEHHTAFMKNHSAVLYFHGKPGTIANLDAAREIAEWPEVISSQIFYQEGDAMLSHGPQPYAARFCISGKSRQYIDNITKKIFEAMSFKDYQGRELLYQNKMTEYPE